MQVVIDSPATKHADVAVLLKRALIDTRQTPQDILGLFDRWLDRTWFPAIHWGDSDRRRVDVVRMAVAAIMTYRVALILDASRYYFGPVSGWHGLGASEAQFALFELALAIALFIGFLTPLCIATILLTYYRFDTVLTTRTLGSQVFMHLLVLLLLIGAGSSISIDAVLIRRAARRSRVGLIARLYGFLGEPSSDEVRLYLFIGLVAYWVLSLGGLLNHAVDPYWQSGDTVRAMLQSSYISRVAGPARELERNHPAFVRGFSQTAVFGQGVFQLAMVFLIRWKWGYRFVVWWGAAFFLVSLLVLQLSYLPPLEICLWVSVFGRSRQQRSAADGDSLPREPDEAALGQTQGCAEERPVSSRRSRSARASVGLAIGLLTVCGIAVVCFPQTERAVDSVLGVDIGAALSPIQPRLNDLLAAAGLNPPNVFNSADLQIGDAWPVIYRVEPDRSTSLVPLSAADGHRLWYHWSDVIYFGNALQWRRAMIGADLVMEHQPGMLGYQSIERILLYDYRRHGRTAAITYQVDIFQSGASRMDLPANERFAATLVYSYTETLVEPSESPHGL